MNAIEMTDDRLALLEEIHDDVEARVSGAGTELQEDSRSRAFLERVLADLSERGYLFDPWINESNELPPVIEAADFALDRGILTLFVCAYEPRLNLGPIPLDDVASRIGKIDSIVNRCVNGSSSGLTASELRLRSFLSEAQTVNLWVISNGVWSEAFSFTPELVVFGDPSNPAASQEPPEKFSNYEVWSLDSLVSLLAEGEDAFEATIDLTSVTPVRALGPFENRAGVLQTFLAVFPGDLLAELYQDYGPPLLELNVRGFLNVRNKVNAGIQQTLENEPEMFMAYNNGLSLVASEVGLALGSKGDLIIESATGMQVVNGGQTMASLHYAKFRLHRDLSKVLVQAKLAVLEKSKLSEYAPLVSRFANSQSVVKMADFSSHDPIHRELEKLSRAIPTPIPTGPELPPVKWFYERFRGQYISEQRSQGRGQGEARFAAEYPTKKRILKTDYAKYELAWEQQPHTVCKGAEVNFREFMLHLAKKSTPTLPDATHWKHAVARAILFRETDEIIKDLGLGGWKAQTVAYTVAVLSWKTKKEFNFDSIWQNQALSVSQREAIRNLAPIVRSALLQCAGVANAGMYARREEAWASIKKRINWSVPSGLLDSQQEPYIRPVVPDLDGARVPQESPQRVEEAKHSLKEIDSATWDRLGVWATREGQLTASERQFAFKLGKLSRADEILNERQVLTGAKLIQKAILLGFSERD
jgi:hypothetical protein